MKIHKVTNMTEEETQKYKKFLQDELDKVNGVKVEKTGKKEINPTKTNETPKG